MKTHNFEDKETFQKNGFVILKNVLTRKEAIETNQYIHSAIERCADELGCSTNDYLSNVSRWVDPSPITRNIDSFVNVDFKMILQNFIGNNLTVSKMNIICKSPYARRPIPCHQDISYSSSNPYEFSFWVALQNVSLQDGVLQCLPASHLGEIEPAIDFWQPSFKDEKFYSSVWQEQHISLPVEIGDGIVFDSRVWHRSAENVSGSYRFAIVSRWSQDNYQPPSYIPPKIPAKFGMWTCGQVTEQLLREGLLYCFQVRIESEMNFIKIIQLWIDNLCNHKKLDFQVDYLSVIQSLQNLFILHQASILHNGGDAQGVVYANLWYYLLNPLSQWLDSIEIEEAELYERTV